MWQKIGVDLKTDYSGTKKLLYSMTKNYRSSANKQTDATESQNGHLLVHPGDIATRRRDYFTDLLTVQSVEILDVDVDLETDLDEDKENITDAEVSGANERMKKGKAT